MRCCLRLAIPPVGCIVTIKETVERVKAQIHPHEIPPQFLRFISPKQINILLQSAVRMELDEAYRYQENAD